MPHSTGLLMVQCTNMESHGILLFPHTNDAFKIKWFESVVTTELNKMQQLSQNKVKEMLPAMAKPQHLIYPRRRAWNEGDQSNLKVSLVLLISQHKSTYFWTGLILWNNCLQSKYKSGFKKWTSLEHFLYKKYSCLRDSCSLVSWKTPCARNAVYLIVLFVSSPFPLPVQDT
jgi:hypothetical protein